jgi:ribosome-binding protein aMBF1 (putative translation factor)
MPARTLKLEQLKEQWLQDPEFRAEYEALELAYQAAYLRVEQGLTQGDLAERMGTKQPDIARFESGRRDPSLRFLRRLASALGYDLEIRWIPRP